MSDILIHIGYAKTATSFIQSTVFSGYHPSFVPFDPEAQKTRTYRKPGKSLFFDTVNGQNAYLPYRFQHGEIRDRIANHPKKPDTITAISSEDLAGHPFSGGVWGEGILDRIRATVERPKILITIREQRKMLLSTYADYLDRSGGLASLNDFLAPYGLDQAPAHVVEYYEFSYLIAAYRKAFGAENVLVLPMEAIAADADAAINRICDHCNVPYSEGWKDAPIAHNKRNYNIYTVRRLMRRANIWARPKAATGHAGRNVPGIRDAIRDCLRFLIPNALRKWLEDRDQRKIESALRPSIAEDNARLQAFVDDDLQALGYLMPDNWPNADQS